MSERTIKEFVFNALLVQDSFNSLEKEGISVSSSDDFVAISRVVERDFSPRVWADAISMVCHGKTASIGSPETARTAGSCGSP